MWVGLTNAERQRRYRLRAKREALVRIDVRLPSETAIKLGYLAWHWDCTKAEALGRALMDVWEQEGNPIPSYSPEE